MAVCDARYCFTLANIGDLEATMIVVYLRNHQWEKGLKSKR